MFAASAPAPVSNKYREDVRIPGGIPPDRPEGTPSDAPRFMTSTWHKNPENRTPKHFFAWLAYPLIFKGEQKPREGKMAVHHIWKQHLFVLPQAVAPMVVQYISMKYYNYSWPCGLAFLVYTLSFMIFSHMMILHMNKLGAKHGFLDSQVPRDGIPDIRLEATVIGLILTTTVRPLLGCFIAYNRYQLPHISPWLPVHLFIFTTTLDFYYYMYHRAMHEVDFLWKFHKMHHMTKHPNPLLSAFAGPEQDLFDIFLIPLLTFLTYPVDFHTWWICTIYILYVEAAGHTGIRVYWEAPIGAPLLRHFDMELILEDHDLHHRYGWRQSANYGKQTRVWDRLFGTTRPRLEMIPENAEP